MDLVSNKCSPNLKAESRACGVTGNQSPFLKSTEALQLLQAQVLQELPASYEPYSPQIPLSFLFKLTGLQKP